jgi:uncharacterized protein with GYD domain
MSLDTGAGRLQTGCQPAEGRAMAKYLIVASYTKEGVKGVIAKGGTARRDAIEKMAAELDGRVESFYFGFGEGDAFVIVDLPDKTTVLLTPEEVDRAAATTVNYRPPGS